nr:retrotransposon protein, putative, Ty1-copia subclass [Tanacetum cinerariifolium]
MSSIPKFDVEKFDGSNDFGLWRVKMRCLLIQHSWEAALDPFPGTMTDADKTATLKTDALLLCLDNKVLRKVNKEDSTAGERESLTLEDVLSSLNSRELRKKTDAKDDGDGLYVRERSDHRGNQGRGGSRSKSKDKGTYKLKCCICYSKDHLKKDCPKRNKKKSTGFVKKNAGQGFGMHSEGYDNGDLLMTVSEERYLEWIMDSGGSYHITPKRDFLFDFKEFNGGTILLGDNRSCAIMRTGKVRVQMKDGSSFVLGNVRYILELKRNLISLGTLDREGYTVKLQNGRVKVINGSLMVLSGTMKGNCVYFLDGWAESGEASIDSFWAEAMAMASYLINRSPSIVLKKKTPMDLWSGHLANYEMLKIFGCVAYSHVNQGKLKPRAIKCIFLSLIYKDTLKGAGAADSGKEVDFKVELQGSRNLDSYVLVRDKAKRTTAIPARYMDEGNISSSRPSGSRVKDDMTAYAFAIAEEEDTHEPITFHEAINSSEKDEWVRAMEEEMSSLKKNHTWELVDQPPGQKLRAGIDYNEVFSPVVRHTSIRVILSLTAYEDYELEQLDVKTAFLHGNLEKTIYMRQPPGFEEGTGNK